MPNITKIATCCYCGTRAALVLKGRERHELACSSCGAPLHNLKQMPGRKSPAHDRGRTVEAQVFRGQKSKKRKPKKRKSWSKKFKDEIFEVIEDIFD